MRHLRLSKSQTIKAVIATLAILTFSFAAAGPAARLIVRAEDTVQSTGQASSSESVVGDAADNNNSLNPVAGLSLEDKPVPAQCGDGVVNLSSEQCDGNDFGGRSCSSLGFTAGNLLCNSQCQIAAVQCSGSSFSCQQ